MSMLMVSESDQNSFTSQRERIFNSRSNNGKPVHSGAFKPWSKSSQTFRDIFVFCQVSMVVSTFNFPIRFLERSQTRREVGGWCMLVPRFDLWVLFWVDAASSATADKKR